MNVALWKPDCSINSRDGRKNHDGRNYPYTALSRFGRKLTKRHNVSVFRPGDWRVDIILCSMQSFYDVLKLKELSETKPKKAKIIIGGPACNNIRGYLNFIDGAYFGRCDCDDILGVVTMSELPSLWVKQNDPNFQKKYIVAQAQIESFLADQLCLFGDAEFIEHSVGCPMKCSFCFYSHWNKFTKVAKTKRYTSGTGPYEDWFNSFQWKTAARGGVSALDGSNESTRYRVNKKISTEDIRSKLLEVNESSYGGLHRIKLYNIYGYPWECPSDLHLDLFDVVQEVDTLLSKKILIKMQNSHFIPYVKTPMALEPFNFQQFHRKIKDFLFVGENCKLFPGTHNQSPRLALLSTIIQRADRQLPDSFFDKKLWKADYLKLKKYAEDNGFSLGKINYDLLENIETRA